ncbi:hypothetical protein CORMATOL_01048 [Corynebacterium matruchotii ATCC 33806]|uniref:Uncharacterized protein n=1 Tax=Corynebacterium matruchotii ATCC 33806 TaxID=566549 RepID=C0E243_9CORY|nr:hypothetical protein CORMATOL_01048 [Corynebacterium matruchotii ATCC 33806]
MVMLSWVSASSVICVRPRLRRVCGIRLRRVSRWRVCGSATSRPNSCARSALCLRLVSGCYRTVSGGGCGLPVWLLGVIRIALNR